MPVLLFFPRAILLVIWIISSLLAVIIVFPLVPLRVRSAMNRRWSQVLLFICGVRVRVRGQPEYANASLWVANHVSWLDIFILSSVRSVIFIAKSDIRRWPVIGWMVAGAGTIFLERGHRHAIKDVSRQMQARFIRSQAVGLFPEGTTSTGFDVLPFNSGLFDPAIRAQACIQPIALRFLHGGRRSSHAAFVGEQSLLQNLWCLLSTTQITVEMEFLSAISSAKSQEIGRGKTSSLAHQIIRKAITAPEN